MHLKCVKFGDRAFIVILVLSAYLRSYLMITKAIDNKKSIKDLIG